MLKMKVAQKKLNKINSQILSAFWCLALPLGETLLLGCIGWSGCQPRCPPPPSAACPLAPCGGRSPTSGNAPFATCGRYCCGESLRWMFCWLTGRFGVLLPLHLQSSLFGHGGVQCRALQPRLGLVCSIQPPRSLALRQFPAPYRWSIVSCSCSQGVYSCLTRLLCRQSTIGRCRFQSRDFCKLSNLSATGLNYFVPPAPWISLPSLYFSPFLGKFSSRHIGKGQKVTVPVVLFHAFLLPPVLTLPVFGSIYWPSASLVLCYHFIPSPKYTLNQFLRPNLFRYLFSSENFSRQLLRWV